MLALLAAVGGVLFIACSNVASLFLVQFTSRSQEFSMRYALGASRMRVLRQLLTESMLLSITGGVLGFGVATGMVHYFRSVMPDRSGFFSELVQLDGIEVDSTLVVFAGLVTLLAGILVVLIPVFRSSHVHLESSLRDAGRTAFGNRWGNRSHDALVMAEVAVAVVLVVASGLLVRSISEMYGQGLGFDPENVAFLDVRRAERNVYQTLREKNESGQKYFEALRAWRRAKNEVIRSRIASLPGVTSITFGREPLGEEYSLGPVTAIDGRSGARPVEIQSNMAGVGLGYFELLRIPLLRGRSFESRDLDTKNAIVNEELASQLWGDRDPIGKRLKKTFGYNSLRKAELYTVIGVVGNVRQEGVRKPPQPRFYSSFVPLGCFSGPHGSEF